MRPGVSGIPASPFSWALAKWIGMLLLAGLAAACTREAVPVAALQTPIVETAPPEATETLPPVTVVVQGYAVAWVPEGENLKIHNPAGIAGDAVGELAYNERGIRLTGNTSSLGSSNWVEIIDARGRQGWVNAWNLTEYVPSEAFCADERARAAFSAAVQALRSGDGASLARLVNPARGLIIRHGWWNPEVIVSPSEVEGILSSHQDRAWGTVGGGGFTIQGSFREIILPELAKTLMDDSGRVQCDELELGRTVEQVGWPGEYADLHYFAVHRPPPENGNPFDWQTWGFLFEYIQGQPYLTGLIHFYPDI